MAKYRGRNKFKFGAVLLCAFAFVMCFTLTSAWGQSHNERTHNQITEAANAAENSDDTNAWELRDYPREETFLVNLIKKYYGEQQTGTKTEEDCRRELKSTTGNMADFGTGARNSKIGTKDNIPCIQIQTFSEIKKATGHPGGEDTPTTDPLLVVNPDLMPRNEDGQVTFPSDKFWDLKPDDATERDGVHICQLYFDDAGVVDGEHVDMVFRVNSLRVKGRTEAGGHYGWPASTPEEVGLVFGRIKTSTIWEQYIKNYTPTTEKPINPSFPQIAGTISLTSDNLVWNSGHCTGASENLQVEVDYSISIVTRDEAKPMPFQYPVYTLYSDLDVHARKKSDTSIENVQWSNEYESTNPVKYKTYSTTSGDTIKCFFDESITPYENTYPYAYRFKPATSASVSPFYMTMATDSIVKTGAPTFSSIPHYYKNGSGKYEYCSSYSDDFPSSWYNTGVLITSDPSSASGAYSAVWRGVCCETGISLSPCPSYTAHKYVEKETEHKLEADQAKVEPVTSGATTDADGYYIFDVDFGDKDQGGSGNYGEDMFYLPDSLKFIDYLPAGLELLSGEDLQAAITNGDIKLVRHYNDSSTPEDDIDIAKDEDGKYVITKEEVKDTSGKVVSYKISVSVDTTYLKKTWTESSVTKAKFNGSTWRMKLKARPKSLTESTETSAAGYSTGEEANYPETTTNMWKYQNIGAVDSENYEFKSHPLDIYTPLFGHDYTFYKMNADGTTTTDPVPDEVTTAAKPDDATNTYKVGQTVKLKDVLSSETPVPKATSVRDTDGNLWLFTKWEKTELTVANPGADLNFIGYWKKIDKPTEIKEYNTDAGTGFITDASAVQLNDNIAYELIATNNKYPVSTQISFTDIPSVGLTFNPSSVVVKKELNGATTTLTAGVDFIFKNNLTDNKGDGNSSIIWNFDADHPVEYTAKIIITYYNTVNKDALTLDTVNNKCTIKVGDLSNDYQLSNPVVKPITAKLDGKKEWDDQIPVSIGSEDYKITVSKDSYSPDAGLDASAFVGTFKVNPYSTGTTWDGSWTTGDVKFYMPGTYSFKVVEADTKKGGVTYDIASYIVKYTVTRTTTAAGKVILSADKEVKKDETVTTDPIVFTNTYNPTGSAPVTAVKKVSSTGCDIPEGMKFTFEAAIEPTTGVTPQKIQGSATTSGKGKTTDTLTVAFVDPTDPSKPGKFTFTQPGTYKVTFSETTTTAAGWTFDKSTPDVSVTVTDNGDGTLKIVPGTIGSSVEFTNTYKPDAVKSNMDGKKWFADYDEQTTGIDFTDGDFVVNVTPDASNPDGCDFGKSAKTFDINNLDPAQTGKGTWATGDMTFSSTGTYIYHIKEINSAKFGVVYSQDKYDMKFVVTDDGTGELKVEKSMSKNSGEYSIINVSADFTNLYRTFKKKYNDSHKVGDAVADGEVINYKLHVANYTDSEAYVTFKDKTTAGLEIDTTSFKLQIGSSDPTSVTITGATAQGFTYKAENIPANTEVFLTYSAKVVKSKCVEEHIANDAYVNVNNNPTVSIGSLPNTVPDKKYADSHKPGDSVARGEEIAYTITVKNETGDVAIVNFKDVLSGEIAYLADSFKLDGVSVTPKFNTEKTQFTYTAIGVAKDAQVTLTYKAKVSEDATATGMVANDAYVGVNHEPTTNIGKLPNIIPGKKYATDEQGKTLKPGDAVEVGQTIPYEIIASNQTGSSSAYITLKDTTSTGLVLNQDSFKLKINGTETSLPAFTKLEDHTFELKIENVALEAQLSLTYTATVTSDALVLHRVQNDAYLGVNHDPTTSAGKLPNTVPEKKYTANTEGITLKPGDAVEVGQTIPYEIVAKNETGSSSAYITFKDTTSTGLELNKDSFKLKIDDTQVTLPAFTQFDAHTFILTAENVAEDAQLSLTYSATVTSDALVIHRVQNDAYLGVNNDPTTSAGKLPNTVPEKKLANNEQGQTLKPGDAVVVGQIIPYEIIANNETARDNTYITFKDETSQGLELNKASFKLYINDIEKELPDFDTFDLHNFKLTVKNLNKDDKVKIAYNATVTTDALITFRVQNDAYIGVDSDPTTSAGSIPNMIPEKTYGDDHTQDDVVNVGDIIAYKIKAQNCTGDVAYIVFKDVVSKGLTYNKDSFALAIYDKDDKKIKSSSVNPEINDNTFTYKAENIADNCKLELTYSCTVTEDAYETLQVNNGAFIGVNNDPTFVLDSLKNPVNEKPIEINPSLNPSSGDLVNMWWIIALIAAVLAAGFTIVGCNFRRKSGNNFRHK